ncbi:MAG: hypothetical protein RLZZ519_539, partial [Bacteroidota bacterium]
MRTLLLTCFLAFSTYFTLHSQMLCMPDSAVVGQALTVTIIGQGTNFTSATSTYLQSGGNYIHPGSYTVLSNTQIQANFVIPPNTPLGFYDINVWANSAHYTQASGFLVQGGVPNGNYGRVTGKIYDDANQNCIANVGESGVPWRAVTITPGPYQAITDNSGNYSVWLPTGNYNLDFHPIFPLTNTCVPSGQRTVSLTTNGQLFTNESFGTSTIQYTDAWVLTGGVRLRPGFTASKFMVLHNQGNIPIPITLVKLIKPSFASFGTVFSHTPAYISGDTIAWNISNLSNSLVINFGLYCPPGIPISTPYTIQTSVIPSPMDYFTANNEIACHEIVVGAWDPNDKRVFTQTGADADGDIMASDTL